MDFVAVPAGTLPAAALALRGADHDVEFATTSKVNIILGDALHAIDAVVLAKHKSAPYSQTAGSIVGFMFVSDAAVLSHVLGRAVPSPAKLRAAFTHSAQRPSRNWALLEHSQKSLLLLL